MAISGKTTAALIRALALQGHSDISLLAIELGLEGRAAGGNRLDRCMALIGAIETEYEPPVATKVLLELAEAQLKPYSTFGFSNNDQATALKRSLQIDGYAFEGDRLVPAVPEPVALEKEISVIEAKLQELGLKVALTHYQQAVENFIKGNFEAANSQVRPFLENLFIAMCEQQTGQQFTDASAALQHLRNKGWLDNGEWNHFRHFWADIQDNGPHQGLSNSDEALFRLQVATAVGRYLLAKA